MKTIKKDSMRYRSYERLSWVMNGFKHKTLYPPSTDCGFWAEHLFLIGFLTLVGCILGTIILSWVAILTVGLSVGPVVLIVAAAPLCALAIGLLAHSILTLLNTFKKPNICNLVEYE